VRGLLATFALLGPMAAAEEVPLCDSPEAAGARLCAVPDARELARREAERLREARRAPTPVEEAVRGYRSAGAVFASFGAFSVVKIALGIGLIIGDLGDDEPIQTGFGIVALVWGLATTAGFLAAGALAYRHAARIRRGLDAPPPASRGREPELAADGLRWRF
jgi:hypothetical protein